MAAVLPVVFLLAAHPAAAQVSSAECGTDNLIANRMPSGRQDAHGDFRLVTDGKAAPEGAQWDAPGTGVFLDTPAGTLTYDLGIVRSVSAFVLQADANDSYKVFGAIEDTPSAYKLLTEIESVVNVGHGLRTRPVRIDPTAVRFVRIGEALGDGSYSIRSSRSTARRRPRSRPSCPSSTRPRRRSSRRPGTSSSGSPTTRARASRWCWRWRRCCC